MKGFSVRAGFDQALAFGSAQARREADRFFRDLVGRAAPRRPRAFRENFPAEEPGEVVDSTESAPAYPVVEVAPESSWTTLEDIGISEAVPQGGRGQFRHEPLGGDAGDNVEARFNVDGAAAPGSTVDVVIHLHGFGSPTRGFIARKAAAAGVDLVDATGTVRVRSSRPTLALVPRGRHVDGTQWVFDRLPDAAALNALVEAGLTWLSSTVLGMSGGGRLARGRLTLTAHSGGGAGLSALLAHGVDPDEVVCFDSMYGGEEPIRRWMEARVASPQAARSGLRAFYTACYPGAWTWRGTRWILQSTEVSARRLQHAIDRALAAASNTALASRFRVERTSVAHGDIPSRYGPLLLDDMAATVPGAVAPPPSTQRPTCVANADWLTAPARRAGGDAPPAPAAPPAGAPPPAAAREVEVLDPEDLYTAPDARAYSPSSAATVFRTAPTPIEVTAATQWPEPTTDADGASERALRALGVNAAGVAGYAGAGFTALRPLSSLFGEAALTELLRRLRYSAARLARPPHSWDSEAQLTRAFGRAVPHTVILSMRLLLAVPAHFRELARRAGSEREAHALENIGWLLMHSLRDEVRTASGFDFWLPASPAFVTSFANPLPALSPQASALVTQRRLVDAALGAAAFTAKFEAWRTGVPGRLWRLETGRETSAGRAAGAPFYPDPFTIPASINIATQRAAITAAFNRRVAASDAGTNTVPLTQCDNTFLTPLRLMGAISLGGLQLRSKFPSPSSAATLTSLTGLSAVQPAFEAAFKAVADAGWNDLLFETQGMLCFRGVKLPGNPAASRRPSNHSLGIAIDLNAFENGQNTTGSMDPRIVALFEAFRFRWGRSFSTPDPMHFEYAG